MDFKALPFNKQVNEMLSSIHSDMGTMDDSVRRSNLARSAAFYREQLTYPYEEYKSELRECANQLEDGSGIVTDSFSTFINHLQPPPGHFKI